MHVLPTHKQAPPYSYKYFCVICKKFGEKERMGHWEGPIKALRDGRKHCIEKHGGRIWPNSDVTFQQMDARKLAARKAKVVSAPPSSPPTTRVYKRKRH